MRIDGDGASLRAMTLATTADREALGPPRNPAANLAWVLIALLPVAGLAVCLLHSRFDPNWMNHRVRFSVFLAVSAADFALSYAAGEAARKRGDARVLLISLAFLATGGFLALHAVGTPGVLFTSDLAGFKV